MPESAADRELWHHQSPSSQKYWLRVAAVDSPEFFMPTMSGDRTVHMPGHHLGGVLESSLAKGWEWRRSSRCNGGTCVEVARQGDGIMVRGSADPRGATLKFGHDVWREWI